MKNPNPLEKDIEKRVCEFARSLGCLAYKFTSPATRHVPDRLFITPKGTVLFIEFKRLGLKPTPAQYVEIDKIRQHMVFVFVCDSVESGKRVMEEMLTL